MENLNKAFTKTGIQRGDISENIIKEVLMGLEKEEEILRFEQGWDLDRIGIDFLTFLLNREVFAIQVKSSPKGARRHYEKYGTTINYKDREIGCLVLIVNSEHLIDGSDLKRDIKNFINEHF